jgi:hemerythrin superfamily protein
VAIRVFLHHLFFNLMVRLHCAGRESDGIAFALHQKKAKSASQEKGGPREGKMKATQLLKKDHATVKGLFARFRQTSGRAQKARQGLVDRIATELEVHAQIEEELFYPAMRAVPKAAPLLEEAHEEHEHVKSLVAEMQSADDAAAVAEKVKKLRQAVLHHATEEEREMFPLAEALGRAKLRQLGEQLHARKQQVKNGLVGRAKRALKRAARKAA